jgi:hypothetical protein
MKQQDALARVENNCPHDVALDDVHGRSIATSLRRADRRLNGTCARARCPVVVK